MDARIRTASCNDAEGIARVHVAAWRSTYAGVVPESYLERLTVERRMAFWQRTLCEADGSGDELVYVAESDSGEIVGFASGGAEREGNREYSGELYAIYLLEVAQRQGLGRQLALAVASGLAVRGFDGMLLWVLADNPIGRGFYERLGGTVVDQKKRTMDDVTLVEVAYGWHGETFQRLSAASSLKSDEKGSRMTISERDRAAVVAYIAATRYPFPNQTDWPDDYQTIINLPERRQPVETTAGTLYPEIVILNGAGEVREGGVVVSSVEPSMAEEWAALSPIFDTRTETGARHFFVYVPEGEDAAARELLHQHDISYAGLRTYRVDGGTVTVTPVETPAGSKDHR